MSNISLAEISIGDNINFTLYGAVNGKVEFSGKVISRLSSDGIPNTSTVPTDHVNIYRDLPLEVQEGIEDDYTSYNYVAVKTTDGVFYIGEPWLVVSTLTLDNINTATITLTGFRDSDAVPLRQLLTAQGYTVDKIKVSV